MGEGGEGGGAPGGGAPEGFEGALAALGRVVERLERGDLGLEEAIRLYERGAALRRLCEERLREAEARIERLAVEDGEAVGSAPFEGGRAAPAPGAGAPGAGGAAGRPAP